MGNAVHLCSFSVGIDELPRKKQRDAAEVLKVLAEHKRFSVFEATANPTIAATMDRMQGKYFKVIGGQYPWCEIELTDDGRVLLATGTEKFYREGDSVDIELLIYPGPKPFKTVGEVVECLSPTYYRVAYVDHRGLLQTKRFRRSQLP